MDNEFKQKFAPRRGRRLQHVRGLNEEAEWARSLNWETNDYDFFRLCNSVFDFLDFQYREHGFRLDQFVSRDELLETARIEVELYQRERLADCIGVYRFLYSSLDLWVGGIADEAIGRRRKFVETLVQGNAA
jgi:hypothetical protein